MTELSPAILTNDVSDFRKKYADLLILAMQRYFTKLHVDFIDGEFLPDKTVMPADLDFLHSHLTLFAHFMTYNPAQYFEQISKIGFSAAIIHFEAFKNNKEILETIKAGKKLGLRMGLAVNPETALPATATVLSEVDIVQVMGVHPGAQGREFIPETLDRIKELKNLTRNVIISVDGGIRIEIAEKCAAAGADLVIVGSSILHAQHPKEVLDAYQRELQLV